MQIRLRTAVIDDEPIAREGLKTYLQKIDYIESISIFGDPLKALKKISAGEFDVLFLDIKMPGISGLDFLRTLKNPPLVIITTAFPEYALEGFELDVMDYLVKPVSFQKFLKAVNKVTDYLNLRSSQNEKLRDSLEYFFVKSNRKYEKINFNDILFIEALQNYVTIHTASGKIIVYMTLKSIYEALPKANFLKVHKSFIVSLQHIDSIDGNEISINGTHVKVSREHKKSVINKITKNKLVKK